MNVKDKFLLLSSTITLTAVSGGMLSSCKSKSEDGWKEPLSQEATGKTEVAPEEITFSQDDAQQAIQKKFKELAFALKDSTVEEMQANLITYKDFKMPFKYITYGEEPEGGHSLYISLHGGGGAPPRVNDQQWGNQVKLYKPKEGIYVAPRAATNTWDLWHQEHIDPMFDTMIDRFVAHHGVNPDKVYLLGYSAGGDGVYQLAPRMADRWAGAAMMAGHPGDAKPHNLLNLPYFIQCGGKDAAYDRNKLAAKWGGILDKLADENPGHYPHKWIVYPDHGHWMNLECKQALPWMAKNTRNPWPKKINWFQDNILHTRFSWLANDQPKKDDLVTAEVNGQTITLTTENVKKLTLRLNDKLINLDKEITVLDGEDNELFKGKVERSREVIDKSLNERLDLSGVATAELEVSFEEPTSHSLKSSEPSSEPSPQLPSQ